MVPGVSARAFGFAERNATVKIGGFLRSGVTLGAA
jgi:hypothetical protein